MKLNYVTIFVQKIEVFITDHIRIDRPSEFKFYNRYCDRIKTIMKNIKI